MHTNSNHTTCVHTHKQVAHQVAHSLCNRKLHKLTSQYSICAGHKSTDQTTEPIIIIGNNSLMPITGQTSLAKQV